MRVCIFGSRHMSIKMLPLIGEAVTASQLIITEDVCGMAAGADTWGAKWAHSQGIPIKRFPANWKEYGKSAGPVRNAEMADYCDAGIGFMWDSSRGTANMIGQLRDREKPCFVIPNGKLEEAYWVL